MLLPLEDFFEQSKNISTTNDMREISFEQLSRGHFKTAIKTYNLMNDHDLSILIKNNLLSSNIIY